MPPAPASQACWKNNLKNSQRKGAVSPRHAGCFVPLSGLCAYCFHQFPCALSKMVPHLSDCGIDQTPASSWGLHRSTEWGGAEHLKGLREVNYKISWSLEKTRKSPKISSLDAVSCSSPILGISALCWVTVRLTKTTEPKSSPLLPLQGSGTWLWRRRGEQWQKEASKLILPHAGHSSVT